MQLRLGIRSSLLLGAVLFSLVSTSMAQLPGPCGNEICPGRIRNPDGPGLQFFMGAAYNSEQDEYLLTYSSGGPLALRLSPDGTTIGDEIVLGPNTGVNETVLAYNPDENEYLLIYRNDSPTEVFGLYLDGNGQPLGGAFFISPGVDPRIAYSSTHRRYMVAFTRYSSGVPDIRYQMVEGASTAPTKLIGGQVIVATNALSGRTSYGSVSDQFLIVWGREFAGAEKGGVVGNFVSGDGSSVSGAIGIALGYENQGNPEIAYASSKDRWLVSVDDWSTGGFPTISAHFVNSNQTVSARMNLTPGDAGWDVPGPITYVESIDTFMATWFVSVWARARTVDPDNGSIGDVIDVSRLNGFPTAATARTHAEFPQALILTRSEYGADGVHAHIIEPPPGPPVFSSGTMRRGFRDVAYSEPVPVFGGTPPLAYQVVSGTLPPGLTGPDSDGLVTGTPTTLGNFSYRVRVTDAEARSDEQDLTHEIVLDPPVPLTPASVINDTTPTFDWEPTRSTIPSPEYDLVVENATSGLLVFSTTVVGATEYTPAVGLAAGEAYRWYVTASDGTNVSPPSETLTFAVDTTPPSAVFISGSIPRGGLRAMTGVTAIQTSGDQVTATMAMAVDGNANTLWSTPSRVPMQDEFITLDLGAPSNVGMVKLLSRADNGAFFPRDFEIQLSDDNVTFTTVHSENDFSSAAATWHAFNFPTTTGRYLRILVTETNQHADGSFFAQIAEIEVHAESFRKLLGATAIDSSSESDPNTMDKVLDGDPNTIWSTPGTPSALTEWITLDFGTSNEFTRVSLLSRVDNGSFFPRDFQFQLSEDNITYDTVRTESDFSAGDGVWYHFDVLPTVARYLRIQVTDANQHVTGSFFVQIAEIEAFQGLPAFGAIKVSWEAPGGNGTEGSAQEYDIRYMEDDNVNPFDWDTATEAAGEPAPLSYGTPQSHSIYNLQDETKYFVAMKSIDAATNVSGLSNILSMSTLGTPPAAIDDLAATDITDTTVRLTWVAVGDDGEQGQATTYDVRYSTSPINNETDFDNAQQVAGEPAPDPSGDNEEIVVDNLPPDMLHYFAIVVLDDVDLKSPLSNVVAGHTLDTAPPATVADLRAQVPSGTDLVFRPSTVASTSSGLGDPAVDGNPSTIWSTPGSLSNQVEQITVDLGAVVDVGRLRLLSREDNGDYFPEAFYIQLSDDNVTFNTIGSASGISVGPGTETPFNISPISSGRYLRIQVTSSNQHPSGLFFVQIAEIMVDEVVPVPTDGIQLMWTAPGDSRMEGTASYYDIRWNTTGINNDAEFDAIGPGQVVEPTPQPAGTNESFTLMGLPAESEVYIAMKSGDDEVPANESGLSNVVMITTPGVPPGQVTTLSASTDTIAESIRLTWNPVGDDGMSGQATSYDIRYSKSPITNDAEFAAADEVTGEPAPSLPTDPPQTMTVGGLDADTLYYFAMKVGDEIPNWSALSNSANARTMDTAPPAAVTLSAEVPTGFDYTMAPATAVSSSGDSGINTKEKAVDGNLATIWSTPGRSPMVVEQITLDLGSVMNVGRVNLFARADNGAYFPRDFQVQSSNDNVTFTTVTTKTNVVVAAGGEYPVNITPPVAGRYVRIRVTRANLHPAGLFFVQLAEIKVYRAIAVPANSVILRWTAPGDSGMVGNATSYDIRWNTTGITADADFNAIGPGQVTEPTPQPVGTPETFTLTGLPAESNVSIAMKSADEVPNVSALSNVVMVTTPGVPPAKVTTLSASALSNQSIKLTWNPVGDDGMIGQASIYDIRYSTSPITTDAQFGAANQVSGEPAPTPAGSPPQEMTVGSLQPDTLYYFAMKVGDEIPNWSLLSDPANARTDDTVPPAAVVLSATIPSGINYTKVPATAIASTGDSGTNTKDKAVDGNPATLWSTPGRLAMQIETITLDLGSVRNVGRVKLFARADNGNYFPRDFRIRLSNDNVTYTTFKTETDILVPAGGDYTVNITPPASGRYLRIRVTRSNQHPAGLFYTQLAEIEVYRADAIPANAAILSWIAPGDSGTQGTAASYDIRWNTTGIADDADFNAIGPSQVVEPTPQPAGTPESFTLTGLPAESNVYIAMKSADDEAPANVSGLSNTAMVTTPGVAPAKVTTLSASPLSDQSIKLTWNPVGDDGMVGQASTYDIRYSTSPITNDTQFGLANQVSGEPTPAPAGSPPQEVTVASLQPDTLYYFAMKVADEVGNWSLLSDPANARTDDSVPPAAVGNLNVEVPAPITYTLRPTTAVSSSGDNGINLKEHAVDGNPQTLWSTPGTFSVAVEQITMDLGSVKNVGRLGMRARADSGAFFPRDFQVQVSNDNVNFTTVHTATNVIVAAGALWQTDILPAALGRYVRIRVTKSVQHAIGIYYVQIAEIEVYEAVSVPPDSVILKFTAPGDSGLDGTAHEYDIRWNTTGIANDTDFAAITAPNKTTATPQPAGSQEMITIGGLTSGQTYYFALKTADEVPNVSGLSNVVSVTIP